MKKYLVMVIMASLLAVFLVGCQVPADPGDLSGTITWQSAPVAGVTVNVWGTGNVKIASAVSDQNGRYTISKIPAAEGYLVTCYQAPSGTTAERGWMIVNIKIPSKGTAQLDLNADNALKDVVLPPSYH